MANGRGVRRVAFIRAVGPATHRVMALRDLCVAFGKQGLAEPVSLLATGNIFFTSALSTKACKARAHAAINSFGITLGIFVRDATEMAALMKDCPFPAAAKERPSHLLAILFDDELPTIACAMLENHQGPEVVKVIGKTIYVDYRDGIGHSTLMPGVIERRLKCKGTARNWNTITKSLALLEV